MVSVTGETAAWTSWRTSRGMACCHPGKGIDTGVDARVGGACHIASAPCQHRQDKPVARLGASRIDGAW
jgi:hypothetical protein